MNGGVDLHLHSTASDGQWTPAELVELALQKGLQAIALTDHDTTEGVDEALRAAQGTRLRVIPGVEISTDAPGHHDLHILGYYIDHHDASLREQLEMLRQSRLDRARKIVRALDQAGCPVSWERVSALAGEGSVGRPHIALALVEAEHVDSVESAFHRFLGRGALAYIPRLKLSPPDAIRLILASGGVPVLAHPRHLIEHIPRLVRVGLAGLEVYYNGYIEAERHFLAKLAIKHHLIATGGSDFHGPGITSATDIGHPEVPISVVEQLEKAVRRRTARYAQE